ncbi:MAG: DNA repair protein, partial [Aestuariivita sp.]
MSETIRATWLVATYLLQRIAITIIAIAALALAGYTLACAIGAAPWLSLDLRFGNYLLPEAGVIVQSTLSVVMLTLLFYLPSHARMMALETSHRSFHMNMRDVARAYSAAHKADREGVFTLSSEFDSIRDRIAFLRAHPDLDAMEAEVMELAAQMSHVSRELARTYSDNNVSRARDFLI